MERCDNCTLEYFVAWSWFKRMVLGTLKSEKPKFHLGILEQ